MSSYEVEDDGIAENHPLKNNTMMSEYEILEEEKKFIKELFNSSGDEEQIKHLNEIFTNYITNSNNDLLYFIYLLNYYSKCRPHQQHVSKKLFDFVCSCFSEQNNEIQQNIKNTSILKFVIFPEEFPKNESEELKEIFLLLQKDDIDGLISFLSRKPTIDITKNQKLEGDGYYFYIFNLSYYISLINFCCFFGSLKCFKYLLLYKCEIKSVGLKNTLNYSIAGGNYEIIAILKQNGHSFEECLETSIEYHRYELTNWLHENYECKPVPLPKCIEFYNIDAFLYFLEHGHSIDEIDEYNKWTCLHLASFIGDFHIVRSLIESRAHIEAKDRYQKTPLYFACWNGHFSIAQYLIENVIKLFIIHVIMVKLP